MEFKWPAQVMESINGLARRNPGDEDNVYLTPLKVAAYCPLDL
jgi:hypothetical protein